MSKVSLPYLSIESPRMFLLLFARETNAQMMTHFNCKNTSRNRENNQDWNGNLRLARLDFKRREKDMVLS